MEMNILNRNIFFSAGDKSLIYEILNGLNINVTELELNEILNRNLIFPQDKDLIRERYYNNLYLLLMLELIYQSIMRKKQCPQSEYQQQYQQQQYQPQQPGTGTGIGTVTGTGTEPGTGTGTGTEPETGTGTGTGLPQQPLWYAPIDPNNDLLYADPINYTSEEVGKNYRIRIKPEVATKIVSLTMVRDVRRNPRFAEYYSGLLCEISNIKNELGPEWGVRVYIDNNSLRRNIVPQSLSFERMEEQYGRNQWIKFFTPNDNNPDEGLYMYKLYQILNELDFVGIYNVQLNDEFIDPNTKYPYGLIATNYRYHATYDKTKDVVVVKNVGFHIGEYPDTGKIKRWIKNFETTNKTATYLLLPWYKPRHGLLNHPYTIIAFYLGTKPKQILNFQYNLDSILDYLRSYNVNPNNFFGRNLTNSMSDRNFYGGDEIVLNDHVLTSFTADSMFPIAHWSVRHKLIVFLILHEKFKNTPEFLNDMELNFQRLKSAMNSIQSNDNNDKINDKIRLINYTDLNTFLFGDNDNKYCCLLPLYNQIQDMNLVIAYYIAYINTCNDLVNMQYMPNYAKQNIHEYFVNSIKLYMANQIGANNTEIDRTIFGMTCTNNMMFETAYPYYPMPDSKYWFNIYYTAEQHINAYMYWEYLIENLVYTEFLNTINNKWLSTYNAESNIKLKIVLDNVTDATITTAHREYLKCVPTYFKSLVGGASSQGQILNINCRDGLMVENVVIQEAIIQKQIYNTIVPNSLLYQPMEGGSLQNSKHVYRIKYYNRTS